MAAADDESAVEMERWDGDAAWDYVDALNARASVCTTACDVVRPRFGAHLHHAPLAPDDAVDPEPARAAAGPRHQRPWCAGWRALDEGGEEL